mgnify:CR=1 FL=1
MKKKILIVLAHPQAKSYCSALAQAYADGARAAGAEVRQVNLAEITFNPVGSGSHAKLLELEPALKQAQADIQWAEHLVFAYPILWGTIPALLKGYLRVGAWIGGEPAWDEAFGTADLFVMMPLERVEGRYARHYLKAA